MKSRKASICKIFLKNLIEKRKYKKISFYKCNKKSITWKQNYVENLRTAKKTQLYIQSADRGVWTTCFRPQLLSSVWTYKDQVETGKNRAYHKHIAAELWEKGT